MRTRRSIRRKMVVGLWLVLLMLGTLAASSISGVYAYRRVVRDLEIGIQEAPRSNDLTAAVGQLFKPLGQKPPDNPDPRVAAEFAERQHRKLLETLADVRNRLKEFHIKLHQMSPSVKIDDPELNLRQAIFRTIENSLKSIDGFLSDDAFVAKYDDYVPDLLQITNEAFDAADDFPDPSRQLLDRLKQAQTNYRWHLGVVWVAGAATLALLLNLVRCAIRWIIHPIQELHLGARRVAEGDFDYRLCANTNDEMSELAQDFNQMTERFQAIKADLDRQVQERVQQLIRSERLAGLGFLSAGVAHEINNPLSAIAMAAESLEYRLQDWLPHATPEDAAEVREYLHMMQEEAQRCRQITEKLLDFARGQEGERNLYDVTAIVRDVVGMTKHLGRFRDRHITINRDSPCYAWVNGPEIKQVVLNLVANALESTDDNGKLDIIISERPDQVELSFTDNGTGMTPDVLKHLFEPFFTTKEVGKGTGLGLSISQRIVCDHDGTLEATSAGKGAGSTFRLRLPVSAPADSNRAAA